MGRPDGMGFIFSCWDGIGSLGLFLITSSAPLPTGADLFLISPDRSFILTGHSAGMWI